MTHHAQYNILYVLNFKLIQKLQHSIIGNIIFMRKYCNLITWHNVTDAPYIDSQIRIVDKTTQITVTNFK